MESTTHRLEMEDKFATRKWFKPHKLLQMLQNSVFWSHLWLGWLFVYCAVLFFLFVNRSVGLSALISMFGTENDRTLGVALAALGLGLLQDLICATYLVIALWCIDFVLHRVFGASSDSLTVQIFRWKRQRVIRRFVTFVSSFLLFIAMATPFVADILLVRLRSMRFTFEIVSIAIAESDMVSSVAISTTELNEAYVTGSILFLYAIFFAAVRTWTSWADLMRWSPTDSITSQLRRFCCTKKEDELWTPKEELNSTELRDDKALLLENGNADQYAVTVTPKRQSCSLTQADLAVDKVMKRKRLVLWIQSVDWLVVTVQFIVAFLAVILLPMTVLTISQNSSPLIANVAMDTTINELFVSALKVTKDGFLPVVADGTIERASVYIHKTENYSLFAGDSLYRQTRGFQGDLAFNVTINDSDPPNVLVIAIESFRFHDSHYLVGNEDPSRLFKGWNGTIVPNFDKWAKRGVAFPNLWSSWKTSRSLASLLFAQVPYDSIQSTDSVGGKEDVKLAGMPQLFKKKGYETFFTTGTGTFYDDWDKFLPSHGFDNLWDEKKMMELGESDLGINPKDWFGVAKRRFKWGVHDDLSFEILGNLLINKTKDQEEQIAAGKAKQPLFLTHYTISSHTSYKDRPKWYADSKKPDFSALYHDEKYAENIKNYLEMRYFTDMELGKFMARMAINGILNNTIIVIVGDHGQAPEFGNNTPEKRDVSCTHVAGAIIAEGRLGKYIGLKIEDAVEQYDMLNTLADITGVPADGFFQDGVGRSLKRKISFGERVVYSNNPNVKNSIVRGHERLRYDRSTSSILLHNAYIDHDMKYDLFPILSTEKKKLWRDWRDKGRQLTAYYKKRWDEKCLLAATC